MKAFLSLLLICNLVHFLLATPTTFSNESEDVLNNNDVADSDEDHSLEDSATEDTNELAVSKKVFLDLYRRNDPDYPFSITENNFNEAPLNRNLSTEILIHGWLNSGDSNWILRMKDKYFLNGDINVIVVDWSSYAQLGYVYASNKVEKVADYVTKILTLFVENEMADPERVHIVGHCLGGHLAGFIGKKTQRKLSRNIGRITGLDVARTFYEFPWMISKKKRLIKEDAVFVDIIHACGGNYGFKAAIGHVDFYPNGGTSRQPGCNILLPLTCSRLRSIAYYTESINTKDFLATPCSSWKQYKKGKCDGQEKMIMGLHIDVDAASQVGGKFFLKTNKREPFAIGK